jgi:TIR domain
LRDTVQRKFRELGVPANLLTFLNERSLASRDSKSPIVGVYLGFTEPPRPLSAGVAKLVRGGLPIIPVVKQLTRFQQCTPPELHGVNGMELRTDEDPQLERLASVVLENLNLLRSSRRLFISYRRAETRTIAIQLYEYLDQQGFDVFLDTHSIRPGEPFQEVLWHRLTDTDVVVVLDSPDFMSSRWTVEELTRANSTNIQIVQMLWPGVVITDLAAFSKPIQLSEADFLSANLLGPAALLTETCLATIGVEVERLRARAIAARYAYVIQEFCSEAQRANRLALLQPHRFILVAKSDETKVVVVPTVGVPDAFRYEEIEQAAATRPHGPSDLVLLYDERGIRNRWVTHLEWLDEQLRVKSLQVAKAQSWLESL